MRNPTHRNRRKKVCGKHRCYPTREDGAVGMFLLSSRTGTTGLSVFRCKLCGEFHVGHTPRAIKLRYGLEMEYAVDQRLHDDLHQKGEQKLLAPPPPPHPGDVAIR
jgi:hypothetical protein